MSRPSFFFAVSGIDRFFAVSGIDRGKQAVFPRQPNR